MESILIIILLLLFSAYFSASEMAFSTANRLRLRNAASEGNERAKTALRLIDDFDRTLSTILVGNNIVNILSSSIATAAFTVLFGSAGVGIATAVMTVVILICGEIIPKSYAKLHADKLALSMAASLKFIKVILTPFVLFFSLFNKIIRAPKDEQLSMTEDELRFMIDEIADEGVIPEENSELMQSAIDFDHISVRQIITPRVDVDFIDIEDSPEEIRAFMEETRHSRLPVYRESVDNIIGVLYKSEYFLTAASGRAVSVESLLRKALFIPASLKISAVLRQLQKAKIHLAIVTDEHGGTLGVVTLEDILEELVGEIWDESDEVEYPIIRKDDHTFVAEGDADLEEVAEFIGLDYEALTTDAMTVGGFLLEQFSRIPGTGEHCTFGGFLFTVLETKDNRIITVQITDQRTQDENDD